MVSVTFSLELHLLVNYISNFITYVTTNSVDGDFPNIICEVIWTDVCSGDNLNADEEQLCDEVNSEGCNFDMEMVAVNPSLRGVAIN